MDIILARLIELLSLFQFKLSFVAFFILMITIVLFAK